MMLPRGKLVKEQFNPAKMNWLEAIRKLGSGSFSGFMDCWDLSGRGVVLFVQGRLVAARFDSQTGVLLDGEAFEHIFSRSLAGEMILAIYRLSPDLALQVYGMLTGEMLYGGQQLHLLDVPYLLDKLKADRFSGCLRVYAAEDVALVFYREGRALGFFHDGNAELARTADLEKSVARLPGATIDIIAGRPELENELPDLVKSLDIAACWQTAVAQMQKAG
jgi:hypothetical protein